MKPLISRIWILLIVAVACSSCRRFPASTSQSLDIEQVVGSPQLYDHQLLTIHGCYVTGFEKSGLLPCQGARQNQLVCVEDAGTPLIKPSESNVELGTPPERPVLFEYSKTRSDAAFKKLDREVMKESRSRAQYRLEVTIVGQFDTVPSPNPQHYGFGHLNTCSHRLLLLDVLSAKLEH